MSSDLNPRRQATATIAAFAAAGRIPQLREALAYGLDAGLTVNEIKEILIQMYAYAGFPRSLNGLGAFMAVLEERAAKGITDEAGPEPKPLPLPTDTTSVEFGTTNQTKLSGKPVTGPLFDFAPAIDEFLKGHLFGDVFARDNLDWPSREIATVAALATLDGLESQLQSHFGIALNTGLTGSDLRGLVTVLRERVGESVGERAGIVLDNVLN